MSKVGALKFCEQLTPGITTIIHRLSCVQSKPSPMAVAAANGALIEGYRHKDTGLTYGGAHLKTERARTIGLELDFAMADGAPVEIEAGADATAYATTDESIGNKWGSNDLLGLYVTYGGAAVMHQAKKIHLVLASNGSFGTEAFGTNRAGEALTYIESMARAFGHASDRPKLVVTDSMSNAQVTSGHGTASRAKHILRHLHSFLQKVRFGEVVLKHIPGKEMPADFLTKFVDGPKYWASVRYLTGQRG